MMARFIVTYGEIYGSRSDYIVYDQHQKKIVSEHDTKSQAIATAQIRNNFSPIDGNENTYGRQLAAEEARGLV